MRAWLRRFHLVFLKRKLPDKLAIYLHKVVPEEHARLRECLAYFKQRGYAFVGPRDLCAAGSTKRIMVSFDDNFRSWLDMLPLLRDLEVTATFFINTLPIRDGATPEAMRGYYDRVEEPGEEPLAGDEIREIAAMGHVIGCHTHSHFSLVDIDAQAYPDEIDRSARLLEAIIGREVADFAIPYGKRRHFNRALREHCVAFGFKTIAYAIPGRQHARRTPLWIDRSPWNLDATLDYNLENLRIDGRIFERLTGRRVGI